jgi:cytochrome c oxidase subunit 2
MRRWALTPSLALAGCSTQQSALAPAADEAGRLHGLLTLSLWVCGPIYLLVLAFLGWAIWRGRRRLAQSPDLAPDDRGLRRGFTAWVAVVAIGLSVLAVGSFMVDRAMATHAASGPPTVRITGQQWWWRIEVRDPATGHWVETANELHLPLGRPTRIEIVSADVIHSFWVPNLAGKIDMVPGRTNEITITPRQVGWYRGQCAEFCGLQHAGMALEVRVEPPAQFAAWVAAQGAPAAAPQGADAAHGAQIFAGGPCVGCHTIRGGPGNARPGPDLTHVASRRHLAAGELTMSRGALMGWITQPQAIKPGAEMPASGLSPADANALVAYLEQLR